MERTNQGGAGIPTSRGREVLEGRAFKVSGCQAVRFAKRREWGMASKDYFRKMNLAVVASEETTVVTECKAVQNW